MEEQIAQLQRQRTPRRSNASKDFWQKYGQTVFFSGQSSESNLPLPETMSDQEGTLRIKWSKVECCIETLKTISIDDYTSEKLRQHFYTSQNYQEGVHHLLSLLKSQ